MIRCHYPFYPKTTNGKAPIPLPCGRCAYCKKRRVSSWVFRLLEEEKISSSSYFVTLTYHNRHVPITKKGYLTLVKKDWQNFMKRLRKTQKEKIKYYAVGEYGTKNNRPHYHAIIYNLRDAETLAKSWQAIEPHSGKKSQIGSIYIGTVTGNSIAYTTKYIDKPKRIPLHKNDDRLREFSVMSKNLGKNYLTPSIIKYHKADLSRMYVTMLSGRKIAMPKYYRDKIFTDYEKEIQRDMIKDIELDERDALHKKYFELYGKNNTFKFYDYLEALKNGEHNTFYHEQKQRK